MEGMFSRALLEAREAHKTLEEEKATRDAEAKPVMVSNMAVIPYIVPCLNYSEAESFLHVPPALTLNIPIPHAMYLLYNSQNKKLFLH
jgi:hypothetical protein